MALEAFQPTQTGIAPRWRARVAPRWRRRARQALATLLAAVLLAGAQHALAQTVLVYPRGPTGELGFPEQVLTMALRRSGGNYQLRLSPRVLTQGRALALLEADTGIDVVNFMTSAEREAHLLPIRFPIDKGLLGMRLLLIHKSQAGRFRGIVRVEDIKSMLAGQGSDWPDTQILRNNGFRVYTTANYAGLFQMLGNARIDYFPRSITEVWAEAERYAAAGLIVEPTLMLRYPTASYFFVNRHRAKLAADIAAGLDAMQADGSFDKLFQQFYGDVTKRASIGSRVLFHIPNPLLPPQTPLARKELWLAD